MSREGIAAAFSSRGVKNGKASPLYGMFATSLEKSTKPATKRRLGKKQAWKPAVAACKALPHAASGSSSWAMRCDMTGAGSAQHVLPGMTLEDP